MHSERSQNLEARVVICSDFFYPPAGGGTYSLRYHAGVLKKAGFQTTAFYLGVVEDPEFDTAPLSTPLSGIRGMWPRQWAVGIHYGYGLERVIRRIRPRLVVAQQTVLAPAVEACIRGKLPVISLVNSVDPLCLGSYWSGFPWKCKFRCIGCKDSGPSARAAQFPFFRMCAGRIETALRSADAVVSNSPFINRTLKSVLGIDSAVLTPPLRLPVRGEQGREDGKILFVTPLPHKGVDIALSLAKSMPKRQFLFVGTTKKSTLRILSGLANVEYHPWVSDISIYFRDARVVLVPSVVPEGFGQVCVEAMSRGIPCIASGIGALPETVGLGGDIVMPHREVRAWKSIIEQYDDLAYWKSKARAALAMASRLRELQSSQESMSEIARRVLDRSG